MVGKSCRRGTAGAVELRTEYGKFLCIEPRNVFDSSGVGVRPEGDRCRVSVASEKERGTAVGVFQQCRNVISLTDCTNRSDLVSEYGQAHLHQMRSVEQESAVGTFRFDRCRKRGADHIGTGRVHLIPQAKQRGRVLQTGTAGKQDSVPFGKSEQFFRIRYRSAKRLVHKHCRSGGQIRTREFQMGCAVPCGNHHAVCNSDKCGRVGYTGNSEIDGEPLVCGRFGAICANQRQLRAGAYQVCECLRV